MGASTHSRICFMPSSAARNVLLLMYCSCAGGVGAVQGGQDFSSIADFMSRFGVTSMDDSADKMMGVINTQVTTGKGGGGPTKQFFLATCQVQAEQNPAAAAAVVGTWTRTARSHPCCCM